MGDVRVRVIKTGEQKILPEKVAKMLKNKYSILGEAAVKPQVQQVKVSETVTTTVEVETPKKKDVDAESDGPVDPSKEDLRKQYEDKFGKKPGGRMGVDSLKKALE